MNTKILSLQQEFTSSTWFNHLEVAAVNYKGSSVPTLKVRLYNNTSEFNLLLHYSSESSTYPITDLMAITQEVPSLKNTKFNRLQFSIYNSDRSSDESDFSLLLHLQEQS